MTKAKSFMIFALATLSACFLGAAIFVSSPLSGAEAESNVRHTDHFSFLELSSEGGELGQVGYNTHRKYYLTGDTVLQNDITIIDYTTVTICLNGYKLTGTGENPVITVGENATLTLCDCDNEGERTHSYYDMGDGWTFIDDISSAPETATIKELVGGVITGGNAEKGGGVFVGTNAVCTAYGVNIVGNSAVNGGGVCAVGSFSAIGGSISGNTADYGGGVCLDGGEFLMDGCALTFNKATEHGGGVYLPSGKFTLQDGELKHNGADYGGGIFGDGNGAFDMYGGEIEYNSATTNGGGMYVRSYSFVGRIYGGKFGSNTFFGLDETIKISGGFFGQTPTNIGALNDGCVVMDISAYPFCEAGYSRAVARQDAHICDSGIYDVALTADMTSLGYGHYYLDGDVVLTGVLAVQEGMQVTLCLNGHKLTGAGDGSVITVGEGATLTLCDCQAESSAEEHAHAYYADADGRFVFDNGQADFATAYETAEVRGEIRGGLITGGAASNGGGISVNGGRLYIAGGTVAGNAAAAYSGDSYGGGVYLAENSAVQITGGSISGNTADIGGGIAAKNSLLNLLGGSISENRATRHGGGLWQDGTLSDTVMMSDTVDHGANGGGGVEGRAGNEALDGGTVSNNSAGSMGGGIYSNATYGEVTFNGVISGNSAYKGGGVYATHANYVAVKLNGGEITSNSASYDGGGIFSTANLGINGGIIADNTAVNFGGGVRLEGGSKSITVTGGTISGNGAKEGAAIYTDGIIFMRGGEISDNDAVGAASAVYLEYSKYSELDMTGGEISGNNLADGYDVYFEQGRMDIYGGYLGRIGAAKFGGGIFGGYFSERPTSFLSGIVKELSDGSIDADYRQGFPYAVYTEGKIWIRANFLSPVYDGSPVSAPDDFEIYAPAEGNIAYSYSIGGGEFVDGLPVNAGTYTVRLSLVDDYVEILSRGKKYYTATDCDLELTIAKATPDCTIPQDISVKRGQKLSEVPLPEGWSWKFPDTEISYDGWYSVEAVFTPEDENNYETVERELTVCVYSEVEGGNTEGGGTEGGNTEGGNTEGGGTEGGNTEGGGTEGGNTEGGNTEGGNTEGGGLTGGAVAGIVIGSVAGVAAIAYLVGALLVKKKILCGAIFEKLYPFIK